MTKFKEKAEGQVKQAVGQIVGDDKLVLEGKEQQRNAERASDPSDHGGSKARQDQRSQAQKDQEQKDKGRTSPDINKPSPEQTSDPTGRKGPVLD